MAGIQDTKRRINSVKSTKKITKAMELVATAKLKRARDSFEQSRVYFDSIYDNINALLRSEKSIKHELLEKREIKKTLYIVISSELGLCGGYNANIYKIIRDNGNENAEFIVAGNKAISHFKYKNVDIVSKYSGITDNPRFSDAKEIAKIALLRYKQKAIDEIVVVYTKFVNSVSFEPTMKRLLPVENLANENQVSGSTSLIKYEPGPMEILDYLIPKYIEAQIFGALKESLVSEHANRRMAMENANDNAEELIEKLLLEYNRARQAAITQEISEIVAGADAL